MSELRLHLRNGTDPIKFLCDNKRDFIVEKTSTGFPTIIVGGRRLYVRDYRQNYGALNNIINFQKGVIGSELSEFIQEISDEQVVEELSQTKNKINETITKIKTQKVDVLSLVKLKSLNEEL